MWSFKLIRVLSLFVICLVFYFVHPNEAMTMSCKYWCKDHDTHVFYCCPSGRTGTWSDIGWSSRIVLPWFWLGFSVTPFDRPMHSWWPETHSSWKKKKHHCPPLRSHCPRNHHHHDWPIHCNSDQDCHDWEKCCYDVCLEYKTCKPSE